MARSEFATALYHLLTEGAPGITMERWKDRLPYNIEHVKRWLNDETIPTPGELHFLIMSFRNMPETNTLALEQFDIMAKKPAHMVSPLWRKMAPTVASYMLGAFREEVLGALNTLPARIQEEIMITWIGFCHDKRREDHGNPSIFNR